MWFVNTSIPTDLVMINTVRCRSYSKGRCRTGPSAKLVVVTITITDVLGKTTDFLV